MCYSPSLPSKPLQQSKQANVLVGQDHHARLTSYGCDAAFQQATEAGGRHYFRWLAPELFENKDSVVEEALASDIYSFAMVCWEVFFCLFYFVHNVHV